jgi:hypothetical protein
MILNFDLSLGIVENTLDPIWSLTGLVLPARHPRPARKWGRVGSGLGPRVQARLDLGGDDPLLKESSSITGQRQKY